MENPVLYLNPMGWRLFDFLVFMVFCFFKIFGVILFKLLLALFSNMEFVAFDIFSIFIVLWSRRLSTGCKVIFILAIMFHSKILSPVFSFLKHIVCVPPSWFLIFFFAIFLQSYIRSLRLVKHLQHLRQRPIAALVTLAQWSCYGSIIYCQGGAYQVIWRALKYQMLYILLLGCLNGVCAIVCKVTQLILAMELPEQNPLEDITSCLPLTTIPLSQRFPGSYPSILAGISPSYRPLTVQVHVEDGSRSCCLNAPTEPLTTRLSCCHCHQCHAKQRRVNGLLPPSRNILTQQIKTICVTLIIFYYFGDSVFA